MSTTSVDADKVATAPVQAIEGEFTVSAHLMIVDCAECSTPYVYELRIHLNGGPEFMVTPGCKHFSPKIREK